MRDAIRQWASNKRRWLETLGGMAHAEAAIGHRIGIPVVRRRESTDTFRSPRVRHHRLAHDNIASSAVGVGTLLRLLSHLLLRGMVSTRGANRELRNNAVRGWGENSATSIDGAYS